MVREIRERKCKEETVYGKNRGNQGLQNRGLTMVEKCRPWPNGNFGFCLLFSRSNRIFLYFPCETLGLVLLKMQHQTSLRKLLFKINGFFFIFFLFVFLICHVLLFLFFFPASFVFFFYLIYILICNNLSRENIQNFMGQVWSGWIF